MKLLKRKFGYYSVMLCKDEWLEFAVFHQEFESNRHFLTLKQADLLCINLNIYASLYKESAAHYYKVKRIAGEWRK